MVLQEPPDARDFLVCGGRESATDQTGRAGLVRGSTWRGRDGPHAQEVECDVVIAQRGGTDLDDQTRHRGVFRIEQRPPAGPAVGRAGVVVGIEQRVMALALSAATIAAASGETMVRPAGCQCPEPREWGWQCSQRADKEAVVVIAARRVSGRGHHRPAGDHASHPERAATTTRPPHPAAATCKPRWRSTASGLRCCSRVGGRR